MDREDRTKDQRIAIIRGIMDKNAPAAPKPVKGRRSTFIAATAPEKPAAAPKQVKGRRSTYQAPK
jgi:hypothetical protein